MTYEIFTTRRDRVRGFFRHVDDRIGVIEDMLDAKMQLLGLRVIVFARKGGPHHLVDLTVLGNL